MRSIPHPHIRNQQNSYFILIQSCLPSANQSPPLDLSFFLIKPQRCGGNKVTYDICTYGHICIIRKVGCSYKEPPSTNIKLGTTTIGVRTNLINFSTEQLLFVPELFLVCIHRSCCFVSWFMLKVYYYT